MTVHHLPNPARETAGLSADDEPPTIPPMTDAVTRTELDAKLDALRSDTRASVIELRGDVRAGFAELRGEMSDLRGEMAGFGKSFAEDRTANVKWMVGLAAAMVAILGAWTSYSVRQAPLPAPAATPTIIYMPAPAPPVK